MRCFNTVALRDFGGKRFISNVFIYLFILFIVESTVLNIELLEHLKA